MSAETKIEAGMNVHRKLSTARQRFHSLELKKTGKNTFAGYNYFELGDFLIPALAVFHEVGLGAYVSFFPEAARMTIVNLDDPGDQIVITSPMGSAALKGCHEVQNIGAVETYQRRYLWTAALEIVEHDALDATHGKIEPERTANPKTGETPPVKRVPLDGPYTSKTALWAAVRAFDRTIRGMGDISDLGDFLEEEETVGLIEQCKRDAPGIWSEGLPELAEYVPMKTLIEECKRDLASRPLNILHAG